MLNYKNSKLNIIIINIILNFLVVISMISQILMKNWNNVFLCIITLLLFTIPYIINAKSQISLPNELEIIILIFIFSSGILGEIQNFYNIFAYWDTILHTLNGFLCAAIGFALIDILNNTEKFHITLSPIFVAIVAICFSMTVGVLWEFWEFGIDNIMKKDMQKDKIITSFSSVMLKSKKENPPISLENIDKTVIYYTTTDGESCQYEIRNGYLDIGLVDTMKDLIVNFVGAVIFSIIGTLYINNRNKYKFLEGFILKKSSP